MASSRVQAWAFVDTSSLAANPTRPGKDTARPTSATLRSTRRIRIFMVGSPTRRSGSLNGPRLHFDLLKPKQGAFALQSPVIPPQGAIAAQDAMTRHDQADGVASAG